jgi:hypothetical protein
MFEDAANQVRNGLQAYLDDPAALSADELEAGFEQLQLLGEALEAKRLRWLAEVERRALYRQDGYVSSSAWLSARFGVTPGAARTQVTTAMALQEMKEVRSAFLAGSVHPAAVQILAEVRGLHPEAFDSQEATLLDAAQTRPVEEFKRVAAAWCQAVDAESSAGPELVRSRRWLEMCPTATGMVRIKGDLDPENGETVLTAIQALVDAELRQIGGRDLRSPSQRRADALAELARRYLDSEERPNVAGDRPHVTVTVDLESLRTNAGMASADHVGAIHSQVVRRIACDASVMRVVMGGLRR